MTPTPKTDITVTKAATPQVQLPQGGGSAPITYTLVVTNKGPDPAADVKVADAAPVGVTFVSATTTAGTCVVVTTTAVVSLMHARDDGGGCFGLDHGQRDGQRDRDEDERRHGHDVDARDRQQQQHRIGPDNRHGTGDASDGEAETPKPPSPEICATVTVTPKVLQGNGKSQKITVRVTKGNKPVAGVSVKISGPDITKTVTVREERQSQRLVQADAPRHHQSRDHRHECLQHAADRRRRHLPAAHHRLTRSPPHTEAPRRPHNHGGVARSLPRPLVSSRRVPIVSRTAVI